MKISLKIGFLSVGNCTKPSTDKLSKIEREKKKENNYQPNLVVWLIEYRYFSFWMPAHSGALKCIPFWLLKCYVELKRAIQKRWKERKTIKENEREKEMKSQPLSFCCFFKNKCQTDFISYFAAIFEHGAMQ